LKKALTQRSTVCQLCILPPIELAETVLPIRSKAPGNGASVRSRFEASSQPGSQASGFHRLRLFRQRMSLARYACTLRNAARHVEYPVSSVVNVLSLRHCFSHAGKLSGNSC